MNRANITRFIFPVCLLITILFTHLQAGQLHITYYSLAEVVKKNGFALSGTVNSVIPGKNRVILHIKKAWSKDPGIIERFKNAGSAEFRIYGGVEWNNPRRSVMDNRLIGALYPGSVKKGDSVALVSYMGYPDMFEILPMNGKLQRKLSVFFTETGIENYRETSSISTLIEDLKDHDLYIHAFNLLRSKGMLNHGMILYATIDGDRNRLLRKYMESIGPEDKKEFLKQAQIVYKTIPEKLQDIISTVIKTGIEEPYAAEFAQLIRLLNPEKKKHLEILGYIRLDLLEELEKKKGLDSPAGFFTDIFIMYTKFRPDYSYTDRYLQQFIKLLDNESRIKFITKLIETVHESVHATGSLDSGFDGFLLNIIKKSIIAEPSVKYLEPLVRIDPMVSKIYSHRRGIITDLVKMGISIAEKYPGSTGDVFKLIEPHIRFGLKPEKDSLKKYRELIETTGKTEPSMEQLRKSNRYSIRLLPGEFQVTLSGFRVDFRREKKDDGSGYEISIKSNINKGRTMGLDAGRAWYLEGVESNHQYTIEGSGGKKPEVTVTINPSTGEKPKMGSEPELNDRAEVEAEKAGCTEYIDHYYRRWDGLFLYDARRKDGSKCRIMIGGFTGKVFILMNPKEPLY